MAEVLLRSDTKSSEFGHLTPIDLEIDSAILELVYISALAHKYGHRARDLYQFEYRAEIKTLSYENPFSALAYLANIPKETVQWVLDRTLFYKEEKAKRRAEAAKKVAEADEKHQSVLAKKLKNLESAHKLRQKFIKDGIDPDEANQLIAVVLVDQRAQLMIPGPKE